MVNNERQNDPNLPVMVASIPENIVEDSTYCGHDFLGIVVSNYIIRSNMQ